MSRYELTSKGRYPSRYIDELKSYNGMPPDILMIGMEAEVGPRTPLEILRQTNKVMKLSQELSSLGLDIPEKETEADYLVRDAEKSLRWLTKKGFVRRVA
jgi:hypothetical protein